MISHPQKFGFSWAYVHDVCVYLCVVCIHQSNLLIFIVQRSDICGAGMVFLQPDVHVRLVGKFFSSLDSNSYEGGQMLWR